MRSIPSTLQVKIESAFQTIHGNAEPHMDIIAQKVTKYLTEGTLLQARTIRTGTNLGPLDICIRREDVNADPTEIIMLYIENGTAKVATLPYVHTPDQDFEYQYTVGAAVDVACDFDGRWYKITDRTGIYFDIAIMWALQTFGEPYLVRVMANGSLHVQQGQSGASLQLASSNVTKCSVLRGWKNVYLWNHDQGVIVAYIRSGEVRYRNYAQQPPDQPALWENERTIAEFDTSVNPASNVSIFRTNDYRVGILAEISGAMHWVLTTRNWATMAIESHTISAAITDVTVSLLPVTYTDIFHEHHISATVSDVQVKLCPAIWPQLLGITNADEFTIIVHCDMPLYGDLTGLQAGFIVTDAIGTPLPVTATALALDTTIPASKKVFLTPFMIANHNYDKETHAIALTASNINVTSGDLTVAYNHEAAPIYSQVEGGCFMELVDFSTTFTPERTNEEVKSDHSISVGITDVAVSLLPVTYVDTHTDHTVSVGVTEVTVALIHVDDINP